MRWQLFYAAQRCSAARHVQSAVHDARHDDGLLRGHADPDRHRQLHGAADDRRPRHGLSAAERLGLLGHAVRRPAGLFQLRHRRGAGHRLVRLCAADRAHVRPRPGHRLLGPGPDRQRHRHDHGRQSTSSPRSSACGPRHDAAQGAVLRLDDALDHRADPVRHSAADRRPGHDPARSATSGPISSTRRTAARPCSGSTCSGSSAIPRFTS